MKPVTPSQSLGLLPRFAVPTPDEVDQMPAWLRRQAREWRRVDRVIEGLLPLRGGVGVEDALVLNERELLRAQADFFRCVACELERELEAQP